MSAKTFAAALCIAAPLAFAGTPASAMPISTHTTAIKSAISDQVTEVRWGGWGGGWRGGGWGWRGGGWGRGWGWGAGAFVGGLALGAALSSPYYGYGSYPGYSYAAYDYPCYGCGYAYPTYGYPGYWGVRRAYWGGGPYWGVRRAYWGGGWGVRRAYWGGVRRAYWR